MKRIFVFALLPLVLLLSACGSSAAETRFHSFSEELAARDSLAFTARLRADYPDKVLDFTLQYALSDGEETVTVVEPESIRGIRARLLPGQTRMEYEDLILETGTLNGKGLSPMSALPTLVKAMTTGHPDAYSQEDGQLSVDLILDDGLRACVRFRSDSMEPCYGELLCDGHVTIRCEITDWR